MGASVGLRPCGCGKEFRPVLAHGQQRMSPLAQEGLEIAHRAGIRGLHLDHLARGHGVQGLLELEQGHGAAQAARIELAGNVGHLQNTTAGRCRITDCP